MLASYHGHAPLVKLLLDHGADPNTLNDRGQSPLAGAVFKGEDEVVEVSLLGIALQQPASYTRSSLVAHVYLFPLFHLGPRPI